MKERMVRARSGSLLACSVFILLGCATAAKNLPSNATLRPGSTEGVLIFSSTDDDKMSLGFTEWLLHDSTGNVHQSVSVSYLDKRSDWRNPNSSLIAISLPPGRYEIYTWSAGNVGSRGHFSIPFEIRAGYATYIGNIWTDITFVFPFMCDIHVTDMSRRDLPLFTRKFPRIRPEQIMVQPSAYRDERKY